MEGHKITIGEDSQRGHAPQEAKKAAPKVLLKARASAGRVFLVHGQAAIARNCKETLEGRGLKVEIALGVDQALKILGEVDFEVAIIDFDLPDGAGLWLLRHIKQNRPWAQIIGVTSNPSVKTATIAIKFGAADYLEEPLSGESLFASVERLLLRRGWILNETSIKCAGPAAPFSNKNVIVHRGGLWTKELLYGTTVIGLDVSKSPLTAAIIYIDLPTEGQVIYKGYAFATILTDQGMILKLTAPASGKVISKNNNLVKDVKSLLNEPYRKGWLIRIINGTVLKGN